MKVKRLSITIIIFLVVPILVMSILPLKNTQKVVKNDVKPTRNDEKVIENVIEIVENEQEKYVEVNYRLTSYWTGDDTSSGLVTGSGLSTKDFNINDRGWYTYNDKLVLATATNECLKSRYGACGKWNNSIDGRKYYNYFDEIDIIIDNIIYKGIILDSCGACMSLDYEERVDLFVSSKSYKIDRGYKGVNMVSIVMEDN